MCLSTVDYRYKRISNREVEAWAVFYYGCERRLQFKFRTFLGSNQVPTNRWIEASGPYSRLDASDGNSYPCGFHKYADKASAEANRGTYQRVVRVRLRRVTCRGEESGCHRVLVAEEMYVPWPRPRRKKRSQ